MGILLGYTQAGSAGRAGRRVGGGGRGGGGRKRRREEDAEPEVICLGQGL